MLNFKDFRKLRLFESLLFMRGSRVEIEQGGAAPLVGNAHALVTAGRQPAPAAKTTSTTLTAAELLGRLITGNQGGAAAANYTLPTAASLELAWAAQKGKLAVDDSFDFHVINLSTVAAEDITLLTAAGWTLVGSMVVIEQAAGNPGGSNGHFRVRRTAADTMTLYRIA